MLGGCNETNDAQGTQTKIARQMIAQAGDYALALKDNHGDLYDEVQATFAMAEQEAFACGACESARTVEKGHGRVEIREYWTISDPAILEYLDPEQRWEGLQGIGMVRAERRLPHEITKETRYASRSVSLRRKRLPMRCAATGALKIVSIGCSIWPFGKMNPA